MARLIPRAVQLAVLAFVILIGRRASAVDLGGDDAPWSVEAHAFVSQGFFVTTENNYLANNSTRGSFQLSEAGVNFTKQVTEKLRVGLQLYASDIGTTGNFNAQLDWFYLDYRYADWLGLRAGRVKIPFGLYNEVNDVDSGRVPILLPQSIYPVQNVKFLLAQTGGEIYGYLRSRAAGALEYRVYDGTIFLDTTTQPGSPYQVASLTVPYLVGGRLMWETPLEGLRLGGSVQALRLNTAIIAGTQQSELDIPATLAIGSVEYAAHDWLLAAEYSRWYVTVDTNNPALAPPGTTVSERGYAMASYRVTPWFQPGAYYALLFPNVNDRNGRANFQHDFTGTLRFDVNAHWLVKLEGHYMLGTADLTSSLNDNLPLGSLAESWGVFLVKTTAYF